MVGRVQSDPTALGQILLRQDPDADLSGFGFPSAGENSRLALYSSAGAEAEPCAAERRRRRGRGYGRLNQPECQIKCELLHLIPPYSHLSVDPLRSVLLTLTVPRSQSISCHLRPMYSLRRIPIIIAILDRNTRVCLRLGDVNFAFSRAITFGSMGEANTIRSEELRRSGVPCCDSGILAAPKSGQNQRKLSFFDSPTVSRPSEAFTRTLIYNFNNNDFSHFSILHIRHRYLHPHDLERTSLSPSFP